jgi:tyrosinase
MLQASYQKRVVSVEPFCGRFKVCLQPSWRTLSSSEQTAYIAAMQCLKTAPSKGTRFFNTLESRYDDFVALHINATRGLLSKYPPFLMVS